eukprot:5448610-Amphidinium_carterae.1
MERSRGCAAMSWLWEKAARYRPNPCTYGPSLGLSTHDGAKESSSPVTQSLFSVSGLVTSLAECREEGFTDAAAALEHVLRSQQLNPSPSEALSD